MSERGSVCVHKQTVYYGDGTWECLACKSNFDEDQISEVQWKRDQAKVREAERWIAYVRTNHGLVAQSADAAMEIGWEPEHE